MFGALYGDVIGSYYENHCTKEYDFEFHKDSTFTDDTVLTVAVCRAILNDPAPITRWGVNKRALAYAGQFKQFYSHYPNVEYENPFIDWALMPGFSKGGSYSSLAAARAVPIGYAYDSAEQVLLQAKASCLYTHKSGEAIRGAQAVALAVFLARMGESKETIAQVLHKKFHYYLKWSIDEVRKDHIFNSRCSYSVPRAIIAFLESTDYESAVRNAVSLGGDADTEACIAGGIAQAYYKEIPQHIADFCNPRIKPALKTVVREFEERFGK